MDNLDFLTQLMCPNDNFKHYREAVKMAKPTCIAYLGRDFLFNYWNIFDLGLWLQDLTFIDDGNPDNLENGLINFEKARMVGKRLYF